MLKRMNNSSNTTTTTTSTTKTRKMLSSRSTLPDSASTLSKTSLNTISFHRITSRATPTIFPRLEQSFLMDSSTFEHHTPNRRHNRSFLIESIKKDRGFLPFDYRTATTFESIRQQRSHKKTAIVLSKPCSHRANRLSPRIDAFGNFVNSMNHLSEQRLILKENVIRKKHNSSPVEDGQPGLRTVTTANFVSDIPNALEWIIRDSKQKPTMEKNLLESMRRERLKQGRYRLLPVTRAENN